MEGSADGDQATEEARLADWHSGFCVHLVCVPPTPLLLFVFDHVIFSIVGAYSYDTSLFLNVNHRGIFNLSIDRKTVLSLVQCQVSTSPFHVIDPLGP